MAFAAKSLFANDSGSSAIPLSVASPVKLGLNQIGQGVDM